ncbi:uncharacterized protein LACBIDRAFT_304596 [Laccaria bicolor S238N-H82]|uniref:Predicted protein n=1 Tax=Laccaria bicolor (strain S238N-H82 / ATCC MYA-4686) TaxID=486041 RepID=B0DLZ4_LACBS|nr:uncharacterized protein LACBIDRAFT_304596 [Laccaria bicolor S238N-H82]EDR04380.1 predicted protein [Laccaria bicolor S238N-H82]|eukprot:XP_001884899.1 predicted protein [Laccaria bicolor S238N-H82]
MGGTSSSTQHATVLPLSPLPKCSPQHQCTPIEHFIFQVMKEAPLLFCLPDNPYFLPKVLGCHAVQEATFSYCGWIFAQHLCNRLGPAYFQLKGVLNENDAAHAEVQNDIKPRFCKESFTHESIVQVIHAHPDLASL